MSITRWGRERIKKLSLPLLAIIFSLFVAGLFVLLTDAAPLDACGHMIAAGFGCQAANRCALLTTLQFATPLLLTGLSATVAFRAGVFSVGQAGQMVLGAVRRRPGWARA